MLATLVGLSLLLALVGGTVTLAGCLLGRRLRARQTHRHPHQAAVRERTRQARRLAAEWPLLAQTLGLGVWIGCERINGGKRAHSTTQYSNLFYSHGCLWFWNKLNKGKFPVIGHIKTAHHIFPDARNGE